MRKTIPKALRDKVWDQYIGKHKGIGQCYVCNDDLDSKSFQCGHIVAVSKGGEDVLENLRPVCSRCNQSVSTMNMDDFKKSYMPASTQVEKVKPIIPVPKTYNQISDQLIEKQKKINSDLIKHYKQIKDLVNIMVD
jgi:hypothetical protein